jgi:class 3 adenylate cyclase
MALTAIASSPPDLVLLDITMPDMNGYQVAESLKANTETKSIPIIFISALNETIDKVKAFSSGGVDYISKPFQFEEVNVRVRSHLTLRKLQIQLQEQNKILEQRVSERTQELETLNSAYQKFVPSEFLSYLEKESITELGLGDQVKREMTIMFADIRDFTHLSETLTPQENINFLNAYLSTISPIIRQYHGFIDKYLGDGVMAIFPKSPVDAVNASIAIREAIAQFNQTSNFPPVNVGAGLHTGSMMIGIIGENERMQGTVIADAVNVASRLEGLTKYFGVSTLASSETVAGMDNERNYNIRCIDHVKIRGKQTPMMIFEVFDSDPSEIREKKQATKEGFETGLALYHEKKFAEASVQFSSVIQQNPEDKAPQIYLERSARYMIQGVPEDWDGVESLPIG